MRKAPTAVFFLIPTLYLGLYFYFIQWYGPFFASRIDPEYPYLLNGLNCARLLFGQIGHVHHPGTPFQILTGIIIRITHFFFGRDEILLDVFKRPEFYLSTCSHVLAYFLSVILLWLGQIGWRAKGLFGMFLMQLSPFFSAVVMLVVLSRYTPDRLVICLVLIICGLTLKTLISDQISSRKYAIWSGIFSGIAICSKISCLPILLIPFLVAKKSKWLFAFTSLAVFFLFLVPVSSRIGDFFGFTETLALHDGLYGGGKAQFLDLAKFLANLKKIVAFNLPFVVVLSLSLPLLLTRLFQRDYEKKSIFLFAFTLASMASTFLVAKHFKNYYLAPILSMVGLASLVLILCVFEKAPSYLMKLASALFLALILFFSLGKFWKDHQSEKEKILDVRKQVLAFSNFQKSGSHLLIDPSWQSAPFVENGLAFGISYMRHHDRFNPMIDSLFSEVFTYEGPSRPMKKLRILEFDQEQIYNEDYNLLFYSRNNNRSKEILSSIRGSAKSYNLQPQMDTLNTFKRSAILNISFHPIHK